MAGAAAQTADPSPSVGALTSGASPFDGLVDKSTVADLTRLKKEQLGEESRVMAGTERAAARDQARLEAAYKAEGIGPDQLKPWDADKEHRKFETDPIQGIGSVGSLFAVIASAFTKAPATNAIQGMAGAINAIKEGNEAAYNRAYESYKENQKLAMERHKIEHEQYQDAATLLQTNMAAGQAKLHNLAVKFGDQQALMLLEHGMNKELFELMDARMKSATQWQQYGDSLTLHNFQKLAVDEIKKNPPNTGDPVADKMQLAAQIQRVMDPSAKYGTSEQEAVGRYVMTHRNDPPDKFADGLAEVHQQFSAKAPNIEGYQAARQAELDANNGTISPEKDAELLQKFGLSGNRPGGASAGTSGAHTKNLELERRTKQYADENIAKGMDPEKAKTEAYDRAAKEIKKAETVLSANKADELTGKIDRVSNMEHTIGEVEDLMKKHNAITGLGGKITRPAEAVSNIFGSNATDRKEFERLVNELQEWAPNALNDRNGRPLSSEASKIQTIIAGLKIGDTTANTARAYAELRPLLQTIKGQLEKRKNVDTTPSTAGTAESKAPSGGADWLNAYPEAK